MKQKKVMKSDDDFSFLLTNTHSVLSSDDEDGDESPIKDKEDSNTIHAVFSKGTARIVPSNHQIPNQSPSLAEPELFTIITLDTADKGVFKSKGYNRTHLSDILNLYQDISKIRREDSYHMIMVANDKLVKHSG
jgi:hypothetical protein